MRVSILIHGCKVTCNVKKQFKMPDTSSGRFYSATIKPISQQVRSISQKIKSISQQVQSISQQVKSIS